MHVEKNELIKDDFVYSIRKHRWMCAKGRIIRSFVLTNEEEDFLFIFSRDGNVSSSSGKQKRLRSSFPGRNNRLIQDILTGVQETLTHTRVSRLPSNKKKVPVDVL